MPTVTKDIAIEDELSGVPTIERFVIIVAIHPSNTAFGILFSLKSKYPIIASVTRFQR